MSLDTDDDRPLTCELCGLPLGGRPFVLETPEKSLQFCCEGCRGIYQILNDPAAGTRDGPLERER